MKELHTKGRKWLRHEGCGGTVSRRTLVCGRCRSHPSGGHVTLVRRAPKSHTH